MAEVECRVLELGVLHLRLVKETLVALDQATVTLVLVAEAQLLLVLLRLALTLRVQVVLEPPRPLQAHLLPEGEVVVAHLLLLAQPEVLVVAVRVEIVQVKVA